MKFRIYTDTSVLGGCEDEEFAELCSGSTATTP